MIFVTGASGLVGAHLIQSLLEKGKSVIALYRKEIPLFKHSDKVIWRQGDILDIISLEEAMQGATQVYHCAAIVSFVPVKAAAGYLAGYADPEFIDELNTFTLPMLAPGEYRAFEIVGDSMLPTPSGSVIVGERVASLKDVKSSNTYIVISNTDGVVYKRIITNDDRSVDTIGEKLTLLSDNPLYEPYQVNSKDIVEVWKAVYIIHKAGAQPMWNVDQLAGVVNTLQDQITSIQKKLN